LAQLVALIAETDGAEFPSATQMDAPLHFAARANADKNEDELEAEGFGLRFATDVLVALAEARTAADPHQLAGRIQASMAHRVRRS
jgi:hypothetical protein